MSALLSLLPAYQIGFGLFCQLADASLWGGAEGDWWVLKQQLPLLLLRVLLHVPGRPSPLVACAHRPSFPVPVPVPITVPCLLLRSLPPTGSLRSLSLRWRRHLLVGSPAAPPQWRGLGWLRWFSTRSVFISFYRSGPAAPSRRRRSARVRQHGCFLRGRRPAFIPRRLVEVIVGGGAPAVAAPSHLLQLLLALPASLLAGRAAPGSGRAPWSRGFWRTHWRIRPGFPSPPPHADGHMTAVAIQVDCGWRWRADRRAWEGRTLIHKKKIRISSRQDRPNVYIFFLNYKPTPHFSVTMALTRCVSNRSSEFPAGASSTATFRGWRWCHLFRSWWCWSRHRVVSPQWASRLCRQETEESQSNMLDVVIHDERCYLDNG